MVATRRTTYVRLDVIFAHGAIISLLRRGKFHAMRFERISFSIITRKSQVWVSVVRSLDCLQPRRTQLAAITCTATRCNLDDLPERDSGEYSSGLSAT